MDNIVSVFRAGTDTVEIAHSEILRYMQYRSGSISSDIDELIGDCLKEFNTSVEYKACYSKYPIDISGDACIDFGFMQVQSRFLARNLKDCHEVYAFAATTGIRLERLLGKYMRISPGRAFIFDAIGSAAIEAFCDYLNAFLREEAAARGQFLRPRFSPGYGDFPLEHQPALLRALDTSRKINLVLTDSFLMVPTKSVTAVIGISDTQGKCSTHSCDTCRQRDCMYRI
ncbi:MAG: Vitamin B12 dependent methionine synthase activation subunit [Lachnospiraceae bacterium]|nr:Vitamin B12 dependent methionine synthase activation subunit [Lachnospiraceae bacterium]